MGRKKLKRHRKPKSVSDPNERNRRSVVFRVLQGIVVGLVILLLVLFLRPGGKRTKRDSENKTSVVVQGTLDLTEEEFFYINDYPGANELWNMLQGPDEGIDLARANLLVAQGVCDVTEEDYRRLDSILRESEEVVQKDAEDNLRRLIDPEEKHVSDARFMALCSVIQRRAPDYNPAYQTTDISPEMLDKLYADPANVFLHGLLLENKGTCANMPLFYIAVGKRLGWPVYGVTIGAHIFVRWDDPFYRMNFEPTITTSVAMTPDDETYLEPEGLTWDRVRGTGWFRSLSRKEMVGLFFNARAGVHTAANRFELIWADANRAKALCPDIPSIQAHWKAISAERQERQLRQAVDLDPDQIALESARRHMKSKGN